MSVEFQEFQYRLMGYCNNCKLPYYRDDDSGEMRFTCHCPNPRGDKEEDEKACCSIDYSYSVPWLCNKLATEV